MTELFCHLWVIRQSPMFWAVIDAWVAAGGPSWLATRSRSPQQCPAMGTLYKGVHICPESSPFGDITDILFMYIKGRCKSKCTWDLGFVGFFIPFSVFSFGLFPG